MSPKLGIDSKNLSVFDLGTKAIPFMKGVDRGMQIRPESEIPEKNVFIIRRVQNPGPKSE